MIYLRLLLLIPIGAVAALALIVLGACVRLGQMLIGVKR